MDDADWKGISEVILGRKEWFDIWVEAEKACECRYLTRARAVDVSHTQHFQLR